MNVRTTALTGAVTASVALASTLLIGAPPAAAAFPGANGPIVFERMLDGDTEICALHVWGVHCVTDNAVPDVGAAVSPDGERVAYASRRNGNWDIYVSNLYGDQHEARLTSSAADDSLPSWSPEGDRLAFVRFTGGDTEVFVVDDQPGGPAATQVTDNDDPDWDPAWSPDGSRIAYAGERDGNWDIFTTGPDGGPGLRLTWNGATDRSPAWSPDGGHIAFTRVLGGDTELLVMDDEPGGLAAVVLTDNGMADEAPAWSPDGSRLAFASERGGNWDIYSIDAGGGDLHRETLLATEDRDPDWAPEWGVVVPPVERDELVRLAGGDRFETAVRVSQESYPIAGSAGAVVLTRGDSFPDALAGTPLAAGLHAPLLLAKTETLPAVTRDEIDRVLDPGDTVYLLGGTLALSDAVRDAVEALGYPTMRLGGADRFETATLIAREVGDPARVFLASGTAYQDALVAGAAAAHVGGVVLLTAGPAMPATTAAYLDRHGDVPVTAVGAEAAAAHPGVPSLVGRDVFEDAVLVAGAFFAGAERIALARGDGDAFADGLTGGAYAGRLGWPVLLASPELLPDVVGDYLRDGAGAITGGVVFGGPVALSEGVRLDAEDAVNGL